MLEHRNVDYAIPDVLRALVAFKPKDLQQTLLTYLQHRDAIVRGAAADPSLPLSALPLLTAPERRRLTVELLEDRTNPGGLADPFAGVSLEVVGAPADRVSARARVGCMQSP